METYTIEALTFTYPGRGKPAISDVSLIIEQGEFVTLCGPSGCGKTTLLRQLKPSAAPHGVKSGRIFFEGSPLGEISQRDAAAKIGFVLQSPENQIVTDKVWHELAFGLESLGLKTPEIRLRVAEMASFFGIQTWFHKNVTELSGGQKQMLALASVMAMQPSALILDEPTSQLDPIAAGEFLAAVGKINRELGVTVILTEHRLEEALPLSDRAVVMDGGRIIADGPPREVGPALLGQGHSMFLAMPVPVRVWAVAGGAGGCPVTIRDGAKWLSGHPAIHDMAKQMMIQPDPQGAERQAARKRKPQEAGAGRAKRTDAAAARESGIAPLPREKKAVCGLAVELDEVWFRYEKNAPDIVKGLSFKARYGEITAILGGNGTGKTTALSLIAGLNRPQRGKIKTEGLVYTLPQNPQALFTGKTVREDLLEIFSGPVVAHGLPGGEKRRLSKAEKQRRLFAMAKLCRLEELLDSHPYDLSGGEQQRAALAKVLLLQPVILLLDEPTKGLDAEFKQLFAAILKKLTAGGAAVIMVSHDIEFCAEYADRCALFFDGGIVTENEPRTFFSGSNFYTTGANRMARKLLPEAVTVKDVVSALGGQMPPELEILDTDAVYKAGAGAEPEPQKKTGGKLPVWRKAFVGVLSLCLLATIVFAAFHIDGLKAFVSGGGEAVSAAQSGAALYMGVILALCVQIAGIAFALSYRDRQEAAQSGTTDSDMSRTGTTDGGVSRTGTIGGGVSRTGTIGGGVSRTETTGGSVSRAKTTDGGASRTEIIGGGVQSKQAQTDVQARPLEQNGKLSKRTLAATAMILILIPLTLYIGSYYFGDRKYYFTSVLIIFETMLPFALVFESRKPQARELVVIAVLCAITVAGRAAFFMLPQFKPVVALVIIAGVAFGGEAGFLVGAISGFVSNMFFGQGPWTPWQMFAFGIIGFLAGILFKKGLLRRSPPSLAVFGAFAAFFIYGGILNPANVLIFQNSPTKEMFLLAYLQGIPFDLVHAAATVTFLALISRPMLEKLDRIKVKYGLY